MTKPPIALGSSSAPSTTTGSRALGRSRSNCSRAARSRRSLLCAPLSLSGQPSSWEREGRRRATGTPLSSLRLTDSPATAISSIRVMITGPRTVAMAAMSVDKCAVCSITIPPSIADSVHAFDPHSGQRCLGGKTVFPHSEHVGIARLSDSPERQRWRTRRSDTKPCRSHSLRRAERS